MDVLKLSKTIAWRLDNFWIILLTTLSLFYTEQAFIIASTVAEEEMLHWY
jgi:hypothetical protein